MNNLKDLGGLLKNAFDTFGKAAHGEYQNESESISEFKAELFEEKTKADDRKNLIQDRRNIAGDVRKSFNKSH